MAEYVERSVASEKLYDVYEYVKRNIIADGNPVDASLVKNIMLRFEKALMNVPAADVAPVVHGRWKERVWWAKKNGKKIRYMLKECSVCSCRTKPRYEYHYCPNCGARMDGGAADGI